MTVPKLPKTEESLVLRTDFSNDTAWEMVCAAIRAPVTWRGLQFQAYVECVSDRAFEGVTPEQLASIQTDYSFVFLVDSTTITHPEHPILVVDLFEEPGRAFRVIPSEAWGVENNLSIANMDFIDFVDTVDDDGVFRGFEEI